MGSIYWTPFGEHDSFRKEADRLWNIFLDETPFARRLIEKWFPSTDDISKKKDKLSTKAGL